MSCCCSFYMMIYEAVLAFNNRLKLQSFILWLLGEGVFLFFSKTRSFNEIGGFAWSFKFWHKMIVGLYNEEELPKYFVVHFRAQNTKSCVYLSCWKKLLKSWNNLGGRTCLNLVCFDMGFRGALIIWAWLLHWAEICGWVWFSTLFIYWMLITYVQDRIHGAQFACRMTLFAQIMSL